MMNETNSEVTKKTPPEKKKWVDKFAVPEELQVKNGRAEGETPTNEPEKPKNFWQRIAPTSKRGRVVFAAGTAQIASMTIAAIAGYVFKHHKPKVVNDLERSLMRVFNKHQDSMKGFLSPKAWEGFLDNNERSRLASYDAIKKEDDKKDKDKRTNSASRKHRMQAGKLIEIGLMGVFNVLTTLFTRNYLDDKLDIGLGGGKVFKTQMIDTLTGLGAMFVIPKVFPEAARVARKEVRKPIKNIFPPKTDEGRSKRRSFASSAAFSIVNLGIPDMIGFGVGLGATLRELDAKEKLEEAEKELAALKGQGI